MSREYGQGKKISACISFVIPGIQVGGYILGEFGNLIAGDTRSAPSVQFELLQSRFHLW